MEEEDASAREREREGQGKGKGKGKRMRDGDATLSQGAAFKGLHERSAAMTMKRDPYLPIADVVKEEAIGNRVSLFAVVSEIGASVRSRGTDYTVTLRIVDQSRKTPISATFFSKDIAQLPAVKSSGDVISLRNVVMKKHRVEFFVAFDKRSSSFALFDSKVSAECSPYQAMRYRGSEHDKEHLTQLRTWLPQGLKGLGLKDLELQLKSLKPGSTLDLVCKVLHVQEISGGWIFHVWDGTDTPAAEFQAISDEVESLPLLEGPPLSREVLCTMPCVGSVLRIFSNKDVKEVLHMKESICWARFWNITCKLEYGTWKGILSNSSGVRLLSHEDGSVVDRLKMYDSRNANRVHRRPMDFFPSNVADVYVKAGYVTLMESLTHHEVIHKFKTLVRVVASYPCRARQFPLLLTGNYCIRLTLEDPTARIHAYVHKDDVAEFFGGFLTEESIIKKMNKLLGVPEPEDSEEVAPLTRNPPWICCCLKSYYLDENDPWGSRKYRIFATVIRD